MSSYFNRYLNNIVTLMNCKEQSAKPPPQMNLLSFKNEDVKHCFFFRNKFFFFFCQKYCNNFSLVQASPLFDGDVEALRQFVYYFVENRSRTFEYPHNNILLDGVSFEENFLIEYFAEVLGDVVWFRPTIGQTAFLDQMKTEVTPYSGINPIPATIDCKFDLNISGFSRILAAFVSLFGVLSILF